MPTMRLSIFVRAVHGVRRLRFAWLRLRYPHMDLFAIRSLEYLRRCGQRLNTRDLPLCFVRIGLWRIGSCFTPTI